VVRFVIDEKTGKVSEPKWTPSGGRTPRYFGIDPSGRWMLIANEGSGTVLVHKIEADGSLTPTGDQVEVGTPMCVKFLVAE
jgi:6-phosphogluconolactonase